ncbi:MAG TPA: carbohydrate kinase family protein [Spirochaetia bacterium]|nr:carbohydrate kinase family protein [Spirochaetia bacterium]
MGERLEKYGAVAYTASAMAKLLEGSRDEVICLSHLSAADYQAVAVLLRHPNINLSGLITMENGTTEIELAYVDAHERRSRQLNVMPPLTLTEIGLLSGCAAVLLMPLNETDIPLACVQKLRRSSETVIFLDAHGLVTGLSESGERFKKPWVNAGEWFKCLDILKMNDHEACWVAGHPMKEYEEFAQFAAGVIEAGPETCWITFGDQSSLLAWRRDDHIQWAGVPVVTDIGPVMDTTGCGDASSAGFVHAYIKGYRNPIRSVILGNTMGSLKATFEETDAFPSRPEISGVIGDHYREYLHTLLDDFLSRSRVIVHEIKGGHDVESLMFRSDGGHGPGADHARDRGRQGPAN